MKIQRLALGAFASLGLALGIGCTEATSTAGTGLYAFDSSNQILAWDSVTDLQAEGSSSSVTALPTPDRTITSSDYLGSFSSLGVGGMAMDRSRNRLWMVSPTGLVGRIDSIRSRADGADLSDTYVRTFQLGSSSSDRLDGSTFGQIAVDVSTGALCITEWSSTDADDSRIWVLSSPTSYSQDEKVASSAATLVTTSGDMRGYGVAVGSSSKLYGYFNSGSSVEDSNGDTHTGARLRLGSTSSSSFSKVIVGTTNTELASRGTLAADSSNSLVYVAPRNATGSVIAFNNSKFSTGYDVAPSATLATNSTTALYLQAIAHPGNKDWLVGLGSTSSGGSNYLSIWKAPSSDTGTEPVIFSSGTLLGIALDGSASSD